MPSAENWEEAAERVRGFLNEEFGVSPESPLLDALTEKTLGFMCEVVPRATPRSGGPRTMFAVDKEDVARQVRAGQAQLTHRIEDLEDINRRLLGRNEELEVTLRVMAGLQAVVNLSGLREKV